MSYLTMVLIVMLDSLIIPRAMSQTSGLVHKTPATENRDISNPGKNTSIVYVSPSGKDTNDGYSWITAKATIVAALEALPNGSTSPPQSGTGTVYVAEGSHASPIPGNGIWIMGTRDPNYGRLPAGWIRGPAANLPIKIVGAGCRTYMANSSTAKCFVSAGGDDVWHPAVWISGSSAAIEFQDLMFMYPGRVILLGVNSNRDRANGTGQVQNIRFSNIGGAINQKGGRGPTVDIGSSSYNLYFDRPAFQGNPSETGSIAPTGLSRSGNVLTVTTTARTPFNNGEKCGVTQADDASFNGSFGGSGITVISPTTFRVPQPGPDAKGGGGYVICDRALPFVIDPGTGQDSGLVWIRDAIFNGGGVRLWGSSFGTSVLYVEGMLEEGDFSHPTSAPVWIGPSRVSMVHVSDVYSADPVGKSNFLVQNDGGASVDSLFIEGCGGTSACSNGPATILGSSYSDATNPRARDQQGFTNGHVVGQTDAGRSSPQAVRFRNLTNPAQWFVYGTGDVLHSGVSDHDGGKQAADASTTGAGQHALYSGCNSRSCANLPLSSLHPGDVVICGVWVRSLAHFNYATLSGAGYSGSPTSPLRCAVEAVSVVYSWFQNHGAINSGDGEWEWVWTAEKISSIKGPNYFTFAVLFDSTHPVQAYDPVLLHVPAGTLSDGEILNLAENLRGYSDTCVPGEMCDAKGPLVHSADAVTWTKPQEFASINTNRLIVGRGSSDLSAILNGSAVLTFASISSQSCQEQPLTVKGALLGKPAFFSPAAPLGPDLSWASWVSAVHTVSVRVCNVSSHAVTPNRVNWNGWVEQ